MKQARGAFPRGLNCTRRRVATPGTPPARRRPARDCLPVVIPGRAKPGARL
ncbi:MAG: hypothetical protein LBD64_00905 [Odoribacteraceae bacterium]|nr:hypothetical protein [Odoribacteraceae bacterium]